jgi:hypothetical protein
MGEDGTVSGFLVENEEAVDAGQDLVELEYAAPTSQAPERVRNDLLFAADLRCQDNSL